LGEGYSGKFCFIAYGSNAVRVVYRKETILAYNGAAVIKLTQIAYKVNVYDATN
jgi:hypothetical protein